MSLFRKLVILFGLLILVILSATLGIVYVESRNTIVELAKQKAVSIIQTIDSALESNIPDYQFEDVLLHLKSKDPDIMSFDIYKLNGFLYDIASTDPLKIGTQSNDQNSVAVKKNQTLTSLQGTTMEITAPIQGGGGVMYSANVRFSIADDLQSTQSLLVIVLLIGLSAIILGVFAIWMFTRAFLSKPLLTVIAAVNDVGAGNLQVDLSGSELRHDEIGHLARSFQRMTGSLQQLMGRMKDTANELNQEFEGLVSNGDYTARGALHVSDVINHVNHSMNDQVRRLSSLHAKMEVLMRYLAQGSATSESPPDTEPGDDLTTQTAASSWDAFVLEDLRDWVTAIDKSIAQAQEVAAQLDGIATTTNGQLGALQEVNHTAAQLSQMASELRKLISTFEI